MKTVLTLSGRSTAAMKLTKPFYLQVATNRMSLACQKALGPIFKLPFVSHLAGTE
jgi:hypothetical protein